MNMEDYVSEKTLENTSKQSVIDDLKSNLRLARNYISNLEEEIIKLKKDKAIVDVYNDRMDALEQLIKEKIKK